MGNRTKERSVKQYMHPESKRPNNPPVGLVTYETDPDQPRKQYSYDTRLDPQLVWSSKDEKNEFGVDTVSLHVHERIDPHTILEKIMQRKETQQETMVSFFETSENNPPLRNAIEFYKHNQNWSNRLIAGDSLLVMNSLLEREGMEEKIQTVYIDPPYGIKYGSNFQPFINKTNVTNGKDEDLTQEPEMIRAFRDTWELGIHSYLSYLRDRLTLAKKLLVKSGSCFVQISDENLHHVREIMDEVFGAKNFVSQITIKRASVMFEKKYINNACFYVVWYAKNIQSLKYHDLFEQRDVEWFAENAGSHLWMENIHKCRKLTADERKSIKDLTRKNPKLKLFSTTTIYAQGTEKRKSFVFENEEYYPPSGSQWKTSYQGLENLKSKNRLVVEGNAVRYKQYLEDYPVKTINSLWTGIGPASNKVYVVQSSDEIIKRCILMSTDPGDLVFDPTCGSGTTAFVAEKWGRRWITCDTSRVAIALARRRLMTSIFDYFKLAMPEEGVSSGFEYETVPHVTLGSLANNEDASFETLYDKPKIDKTKTRITGPFTVEAVPAATVKSIDVLSKKSQRFDGNTSSHQQEWRDEIYKSGIRGKNKQRIEFSRVEPHPTTKWIHASAETKEKNPKHVVISFGPEHAPLETRQVENTIKEALKLVPKPQVVIFAAMQFDPEAAKDIDELDWPGVTVLQVEINKDLLTDDLKKKRTNNESFWLIGQPDVKVEKTKDKKIIITVKGFDYYDTRDGQVKSGNISNIAMWALDENYDGRSVYAQQFFFPLQDKANDWTKLSKALHSHIDEELITKYHGAKSIPFKVGPNKQAAVKIIDDRGIESLKIIQLE